jgi:hypothetical protein
VLGLGRALDLDRRKRVAGGVRGGQRPGGDCPLPRSLDGVADLRPDGQGDGR